MQISEYSSKAMKNKIILTHKPFHIPITAIPKLNSSLHHSLPTTLENGEEERISKPTSN